MPATQLTLVQVRSERKRLDIQRRDRIADERNQEETVQAVADLLAGLRKELRRRVKARRDAEDEQERFVAAHGLEA